MHSHHASRTRAATTTAAPSAPHALTRSRAHAITTKGQGEILEPPHTGGSVSHGSQGESLVPPHTRGRMAPPYARGTLVLRSSLTDSQHASRIQDRHLEQSDMAGCDLVTNMLRDAITDVLELPDKSAVLSIKAQKFVDFEAYHSRVQVSGPGTSGLAASYNFNF